jgi:hypothetical protein
MDRQEDVCGIQQKSQVCNISYTIWDELIHAIFPEFSKYEFTVE